MTERAQIIEKLKTLGISPKRSLGQNFLISASVIHKILRSASATGVKSIVEIGPGLGALTTLLKEIDDNLMLIELDDTFARRWRERDYQIIHGDAMKVDWQSPELKGRQLLVSNLPYQISASLVIELSECENDITNMILMFQKEVAQRVASAPSFKSYGLLSVVAQCFWDVDLLLEAGPSDFYPAPTVASRVLTFKALETPIDSSSEASRRDFIQFVKAAFSHRRKKLIKNLLSYQPQGGVSCEVDLSGWTLLFEQVDLDPGCRAEHLSPENYMDLYMKWKSMSCQNGH